MSYEIQLDNFEGPFDLLLYFIRRDELDIYDIPISKITEDFIETINQWKRLNLIIAGEFIVMASTLMSIKAKMMIPRVELDDVGVAIDPRAELMQQLIDYKRFREASDGLKIMAENNGQYFPRQVIENYSIDGKEDLNSFFKDISLFDLAKYFKKAIDNKPVIAPYELNREPIKLEKQKDLIMSCFDGEGRLFFASLLKKLKSKMEVVITFLAILDLVKEGICALRQKNIFSDIELINLRSQT